MAVESVDRLAHELIAWAGEVTNGEVTSARRLTGGNRRCAWAVEVRGLNGSTQQLFLRFASDPRPAGADPYTLRRETDVYRALHGTGVCMPALVAGHPVHEALLMAHVDGEAALRHVSDATQRQDLADAFIDALHTLHAVDTGDLPLGALGPIDTVAALVRRELAIWRAMYEESARADPLIELGLTWLEHHVPTPDIRPVVVHGDAGPGNFLFEGPRLRALIDWELAHLGDPLEDLAWMSMRCVLEPFPDFARQLRRYERRAGAPVDRTRLDYHRLFVALRVAVIRHRAVGVDAGDSDLANSLISRLVNRRLLVETLERVTGAPPVEVDLPPPRPDALAAEHDYLIDQLAAAGTAAQDPVVRQHVKRAARIAKQLKSQDAQGAACRALALDDLAVLLGQRPSDLGEGDAAVVRHLREGRVDTASVLVCMARRTAREAALGASAIGALAGRSYPDPDTPSFHAPS